MASKQIKDKLRPALKIIDPWLDYKLWYNRIPGLSFALLHKDKILFSKGYGWAEVRQKKKATKDTCYRIASISKVFTAISIMQLYEKGKLKLDDNVADHLSWFESDQDKAQNKITIRQLLSHEAGVVRDSEKPHWITDNFPTLEELKKQVKKDTVVYEPYERFKYSSFGFSILGQVVGEVSGLGYEKYIKKNIINKLNLQSTFPTLTEKVKNKLATGYGRDMRDGKEREAFPFPEAKAITPAAGLTSCASDLGKLLSSQFEGKDILLSDESKRLMHKKQAIREGKDKHYGLGYDIWDYEDMKIIGHTGGFQGYITATGMLAKKKIAIALLTNAIDAPAFELMKGTFKIVNYLLEDKVEISPENKTDLTKYEGSFCNRWEDVQFVDLNGQLVYFYPHYYNPMSKLAVLKPNQKNTFKIISGSGFDCVGEEVRFEFDKEGEIKKVYIGPTPYKPFSIKKRQKNEGN